MKDLGHDEFEVDAEEKIKILTTGNKRPFLVAFQDPPKGATWSNIKTGLTKDERQFQAPKRSGAIVSFDVEYDAQISGNDPDPVARYQVIFSSLSNPDDPNVTKRVAVPKDSDPISRFFKFTVK